jgi:hypothetical protein
VRGTIQVLPGFTAETACPKGKGGGKNRQADAAMAHCRLTSADPILSAENFGRQPGPGGCQLSVIGYWLLVIGYQLSVVSY